MALSFAIAVRDAMLTALQTNIETGVGNVLLRIYDGARPAAGGTATTLLAELTCADPISAGVVGTGVLTLSTITQDSSANASGTATWFRMVRGDGTTWAIDGSVSTAGADMNLVSTAITAGQPVQITSFTLTLTSQA